MFSALSQSLCVCECNAAVCQELEQSSVCVKISKGITTELGDKLRAQACWESHQLPSVMRASALGAPRDGFISAHGDAAGRALAPEMGVLGPAQILALSRWLSWASRFESWFFPLPVVQPQAFTSRKSWDISCEMNIIPTSEDCREDGIKASVWGPGTNWCSVNGSVAAKGLVVGMNRGRFQLYDLESGATGLCN